MKRIDAYIPTAKQNSVIDAIVALGVEGVTFVKGRGKRQRKRPTVGGNRGTTRTIYEYNEIDYITTVAEGSKINTVIDTIIDTAHMGLNVDGKIFVYSVEESYDISSKRKK
jgi:nitrogen regulatory protein PII